MKISVIICCYNSAGRLGKTLSHLLRQTEFDYSQFEIIVVDNNSSDDTQSVSAEILKNAQCSWKIIMERKQGLTAAREAGISESKGELILFCDDDNWLAPDYLEKAWAFMANNPQYGAITGCGEAVADISLPTWFSSVSSTYACDLIPDDNFDALYLTGAGLVIRKTILKELQNHHIKYLLTGRTGLKLTSGEDSEITLLIKETGFMLAKLKNLNFKHYMPSQRLTIEYAKNLFQGIGLSLPLLSAYSSIIPKNPILCKLPLISATLFWLRYKVSLLRMKASIFKTGSRSKEFKESIYVGAKETSTLKHILSFLPTITKNLTKANSIHFHTPTPSVQVDRE